MEWVVKCCEGVVVGCGKKYRLTELHSMVLMLQMRLEKESWICLYSSSSCTLTPSRGKREGGRGREGGGGGREEGRGGEGDFEAWPLLKGGFFSSFTVRSFSLRLFLIWLMGLVKHESVEERLLLLLARRSREVVVRRW